MANWIGLICLKVKFFIRLCSEIYIPLQSKLYTPPRKSIPVHTTKKASDEDNTDPGMWLAAADGSSGQHHQLGACGGVQRTARVGVCLQQHKWTYTQTQTPTHKLQSPKTVKSHYKAVKPKMS